MAELYAMKEKLLLAGIVVCPTLEELYAALNSAKARGTRLRHGQPRSSSRLIPLLPLQARLLGPTSLRIAMPQGRRSTVAGRAKKASPTTRKMQRRRSEAPDTYRLTVNVLSAKLREGSSRVYAWDASRTARASHTRAQLSPHLLPPQLRARQVPRLQAQNPPARQALGAHRVVRLAVHHGALPVQRRRARRTRRRGGAPSAAAARTHRERCPALSPSRSSPLPAPLPLQVYEEAFGSDTLLGEVTIEIARLATVKQKVAEWHGTSRDSDSERGPAHPPPHPAPPSLQAARRR